MPVLFKCNRNKNNRLRNNMDEVVIENNAIECDTVVGRTAREMKNVKFITFLSKNHQDSLHKS